jgi:hypothetical protein
VGEIAELTLEGTLCEDCGRYIGPGPGAPRSCKGCRKLKPKVDKNEKPK